MAQSQVRVTVNVERLRQVAEAFQWFAGRLSAAADELYEALTDTDRCPRCGQTDVVVVRADTKGSLYGACRSCDEEVLL